MGGSRGETGGLDPPGKSHVAIGFFRNTSMDPLERVHLLLQGGLYGPL